MKRLTDTEAQVLYRHLLTSIAPRDVFLQLLFETGARVSETLTLTTDTLVGACLGIAPLKGSTPRTVTLSENLAAKLRRLPPLWSDALGREGSTTASRRRGLDRHLKTTMASLGLRPLNLHALRHTALTRLYVTTKDLMLVKAWAGHRSINSTVIYMQVDAQDRANATNQVLLKALAPGAE